VDQEILVERLFQTLISGERTASRGMVAETLNEGLTPEEVSQTVFWPLLEMIGTLYRADQLTPLAQHYATRLLRSLVDQMQARYEQKDRRGRRICMFCGPSEQEELAAQLVADLAEADGYEVYFAGGGIASDEILAEIGEQHPDILLMFASAPQDAPHIRQMIDTIREINACPEMQIVVGGGIFNRAPGLAEEIGADLWANTPCELLEVLTTQKDRRATPEQRTVGRNQRNRAVA
jgi:methanogenic corrinoid protein MtbC1